MVAVCWVLVFVFDGSLCLPEWLHGSVSPPATCERPPRPASSPAPAVVAVSHLSLSYGRGASRPRCCRATIFPVRICCLRKYVSVTAEFPELVTHPGGRPLGEGQIDDHFFPFHLPHGILRRQRFSFSGIPIRPVLLSCLVLRVSSLRTMGPAPEPKDFPPLCSSKRFMILSLWVSL